MNHAIMSQPEAINPDNINYLPIGELCNECNSIVEVKLIQTKQGNVCSDCLDSLFKQCCHCSEWDYNDIMIQTHDGDYFCQDCADEQLSPCYQCGEYYQSDDMIMDVDGNIICQDCIDKYFFQCSDCDQYFNNQNSFTYQLSNGETICEHCMNSGNYFTCSNCNKIFHNDSNYCEYCEADYCFNCINDHGCEHSNHEVNISHFHIGDKPGQIITDRREFGIEFEAENGDQDNIEELPLGCGITDDASLDSSGVEIQTPPASLNAGEAIVFKVCKALKDAGFEATVSCGAHIHLNARDFRDNPEKLSQVLHTYYAIEDLIYSMIPESRWNNSYCKRLSKSYSYNSFTDMITSKEFEKKWYMSDSESDIAEYKQQKYNNTRYNGINFHSIFYRGTLELRHHAGTINPLKILNWVAFHQAVIDYAINRYNQKIVAKLWTMPTGKRKYDRISKLFKLPEKLQEYLLSRIQKFNPGYDFKKTLTGNIPEEE